MPRLSDNTVFLAQANNTQENLLRQAMAAVGISVYALTQDELLTKQIEALRYAEHAHAVLVVDLAILAAQGNGPDVVLGHLRAQHPQMRVITTMSDRLSVAADEEEWIGFHGAAGLFPQASALRLVESVIPIMAMVVNDGTVSLDVERIAATLRVLKSDTETHVADAEAHAALAKLKSRGIEIDQLVATIVGEGGFDVQDRTYRLKRYNNCFVGKEAVEVLMRITGRSRETSLSIGRLLQTMGFFYHVAREHAFKDANFFYRFNVPTERLRKLNLRDVVFAARGRGGFDVQDRTYRGKSFPRCFVGEEAATWLRHEFELTQAEAIFLGQKLLRLHVIRHVVDDHDFIDEGFFYRFS